MHHIDIVKFDGLCQPLAGLDHDQETVDARVVVRIETDIWPGRAGRSAERCEVGGNGRLGVTIKNVIGDRGPAVHQMDWAESVKTQRGMIKLASAKTERRELDEG